MGVASLITNWTLCISSILATCSTKFLHLENNAEDDMSIQTPPEQCQQSTPAAV